jgi:hypothetical protein
MNNINLLQDKDVNYFIIYFYFALFFFLLSLWFIWGFGYADIYKRYDISWQFDEVLYAYLIWVFFSLLNLSYITIKNNKVKLYFPNLLIIFLSLISIYFILSIENIYKINFPEQFFSLYVNSVIFVIINLLTFISFAIILFRDSFNKYNFILINSYFFLIILFIAMLFIVVNKPESPLLPGYICCPYFIITLSVSFFFLFIPFVNFLFLFLIYFFKKYKTIPIIIISVIAFWDILFALFTAPLLALEFIFHYISFGTVLTLLFLSLGTSLYYFLLRSNSPIQKVVLLNIIMILLYLNFSPFFYFINIRELSPFTNIPSYKFEPVSILVFLINGIILFLIVINLAIYLRARLTLKALK